MNEDFAYGCIIIKDGQVLIEKQKHRDERFWSFPKGHKEGNETDEEAAIREIKEEVGLDVKITDHEPVLMEYDIYAEENDRTGLAVGDKIHKTVKLFFAEVIGGDEVSTQEAEVETAFFMPIEEAEDKLTFEAAKVTGRSALLRMKK